LFTFQRIGLEISFYQIKIVQLLLKDKIYRVNVVAGKRFSCSDLTVSRYRSWKRRKRVEAPGYASSPCQSTVKLNSINAQLQQGCSNVTGMLEQERVKNQNTFLPTLRSSSFSGGEIGRRRVVLPGNTSNQEQITCHFLSETNLPEKGLNVSSSNENFFSRKSRDVLPVPLCNGQIEPRLLVNNQSSSTLPVVDCRLCPI